MAAQDGQVCVVFAFNACGARGGPSPLKGTIAVKGVNDRVLLECG